MELVPPRTEVRSSKEQLKGSADLVYSFVAREYLKDIAATPPTGLETSRKVAVDLGEHGSLGGKLAGDFIRERGRRQFKNAQEKFNQARQAKNIEEELAWTKKIEYLNSVAEAHQRLAAARKTPGTKIEDMIPGVVEKPASVRTIEEKDAEHLRIGNETFRTSIVKAKLLEALDRAGETVKLPLISGVSGFKTEYTLTPQMLRELTEVLKPQQISMALSTDVGRKRQPPDEDSAAIVNPSEKTFSCATQGERTALEINLKSLADQGIGLLAVADGMGGAAAGDTASRITIEQLAANLARANLTAPGLSIEKSLQDCVNAANGEVYRTKTRLRNNMGSTLVAAVKVGETAYIANVGDSRAYKLSEGKLVKVTKDHSLVQALADRGEIKEEDIRTHPQRNYILRNIGDKLDVPVDIFTQPIKPGDQLILCCDGLWEMVPDADIQRIASQNIPESEKVRQLTELANSNGGDDNITVAIAKF